MKKSRLGEDQIVRILQGAEKCQKSQTDICRENGVSQNTFHIWKRKYAGMAQEDLRNLRELEL